MNRIFTITDSDINLFDLDEYISRLNANWEHWLKVDKKFEIWKMNKKDSHNLSLLPPLTKSGERIMTLSKGQYIQVRGILFHAENTNSSKGKDLAYQCLYVRLQNGKTGFAWTVYEGKTKIAFCGIDVSITSPLKIDLQTNSLIFNNIDGSGKTEEETYHICSNVGVTELPEDALEIQFVNEKGEKIRETISFNLSLPIIFSREIITDNTGYIKIKDIPEGNYSFQIKPEYYYLKGN